MSPTLSKAILTFCCILLCSRLAAADRPKSALEQFEDLSHENKGCPENSDCDPEMGKLLEQWKAQAHRWKTETTKEKFTLELQQIAAKQGWPSEFYARPAVRTTLAPVLYNSRCTQHRQKNSADSFMRGLGFIKAVEGNHVLLTKGSSEFRIKLGEAIFLQPVLWHRPGNPPITFHLPLDEKPLYIEENTLVALVEYEDIYALLSVRPEGTWSVSAALEFGLQQYQEQQSEVPCPSTQGTLPPGYFKTFCRTIADKQGRAAGLVQLFWACE